MFLLSERPSGGWTYGDPDAGLYVPCPYCWDAGVIGTMFYCYGCRGMYHQNCIEIMQLHTGKLTWLCYACQMTD